MMGLGNNIWSGTRNQHLRASDPILALFDGGEYGQYHRMLTGSTLGGVSNDDPVSTIQDLSGNSLTSTASGSERPLFSDASVS